MESPVTNAASVLESTTARFVQEHGLPGASVGVVYGGELAWSASMGVSDLTAGRASDTRTLYRIGSITKTFTAAAIMRLRDDGRLHLDDPAVTFLPELRDAASPFGPIESVTIGRLLAHESGLAGDPPDTDWAGPSYEGLPERNLARAAEIGTRIAPHHQYKYSNLGYQLLGEIVARASGVAYVEYITRQIIDPLGMRGTGFEPLPEALAERIATGYAFQPLTDTLVVAPTPPTIWAEGGLWSCVDDLCAWITLQFRATQRTRGSSLLQPATLREMHRPRFLADDAWTEAGGIAWYAVRRGDTIWIQHGGGIHGFRANVCFDPMYRVGSIVLLNAEADASLLSMDLATIALEAVQSAEEKTEPRVSIPEEYRELLGVYSDPASGWLVRVEWRHGFLRIVDPSSSAWRPTLIPTPDNDAFVVELGVREAGEPAIFRRLPDGRVASLFVASQTWIRLDRVS